MIKVKVTTNKELSPRAIENLNKVFTEIFNRDSTRFLKPQKKGKERSKGKKEEMQQIESYKYG